jgi:hypothetical protein
MGDSLFDEDDWGLLRKLAEVVKERKREQEITDKAVKAAIAENAERHQQTHEALVAYQGLSRLLTDNAGHSDKIVREEALGAAFAVLGGTISLDEYAT